MNYIHLLHDYWLWHDLFLLQENPFLMPRQLFGLHRFAVALVLSFSVVLVLSFLVVFDFFGVLFSILKPGAISLLVVARLQVFLRSLQFINEA